MLNHKKFAILGAMLMVLLFVVGFVSNVSAAKEETNVVELTKEVRLLQKITDLNLTNEQIDKMLPILKQVNKIYSDSQAELVKLLNQQKDLLLKRKTKEADALEVQRKTIREKATLNIKAQLVDLETILTKEQRAKMIQNRLAQGQTRKFMVTDAKNPEILALQDKVAKAQGAEKVKLQKQLDGMQKNVVIVQSKDGQIMMEKPTQQIMIMKKGQGNAQGKSDVIICQPGMNGQGMQGMMMGKRMKGQGMQGQGMNGQGMGMRGRGMRMHMQGQGAYRNGMGLFQNPNNLSDLIKVLENLRAAK